MVHPNYEWREEPYRSVVQIQPELVHIRTVGNQTEDLTLQPQIYHTVSWLVKIEWCQEVNQSIFYSSMHQGSGSKIFLNWVLKYYYSVQELFSLYEQILIVDVFLLFINLGCTTTILGARFVFHFDPPYCQPSNDTPLI